MQGDWPIKSQSKISNLGSTFPMDNNQVTGLHYLGVNLSCSFTNKISHWHNSALWESQAVPFFYFENKKFLLSSSVDGPIAQTWFYMAVEQVMWPQLSQCSQLSQSTATVASPTTIVAKKPQLSQSWSTTIVVTPITNVSIFFKNYCAFIIDFVKNYDISYNFQQSLRHFSQPSHDKLWNAVAHHETIFQ